MSTRNANWRRRTACKGLPTSIFYDSDNRYEEAKPICAACPVSAECLADAISEEAHLWSMGIMNIYGLRGGVMPTERYPAVIAIVKAERE